VSWRGRQAAEDRSAQLALGVLTGVLVLSLWLAAGSLVLGIAEGGPHPTRRLLVGAALVAVTTAALVGRRIVCGWLRARPWLVVVLALAQLAAAAIDGLVPAGPYIAFSLTSVALAAFVARPRTIWLTVGLLELCFALAILLAHTPSQLAATGQVNGVTGTVLGYPIVALVGLTLVRRFARFIQSAETHLRAIRDGDEPALTPALTQAIKRESRRLRELAPPPQLKLTPTERRVVEGLAAGSTAKQLAFEWNVSPDTVRTHIKHAKRKTGARTLPELAGLAACSQWVDRSDRDA
jgi:DNA-binding CsgD family transcriptional regulator